MFVYPTRFFSLELIEPDDDDGNTSNSTGQF